MKESDQKKTPKRVLRLPELDYAKRSVLNTLGSPASERAYEFGIDDFVAWYHSEVDQVLGKAGRAGLVASLDFVELITRVMPRALGEVSQALGRITKETQRPQVSINPTGYNSQARPQPVPRPGDSRRRSAVCLLVLLRLQIPYLRML